MTEFTMIIATFVMVNMWWILANYGKEFVFVGGLVITFTIVLSIAVMIRVAYLIMKNWNK